MRHQYYYLYRLFCVMLMGLWGEGFGNIWGRKYLPDPNLPDHI